MDMNQFVQLLNEIKAIKTAQQRQADSLAAIADYLRKIAVKP